MVEARAEGRGQGARGEPEGEKHWSEGKRGFEGEISPRRKQTTKERETKEAVETDLAKG
jgi:hypothetical protein